MRHFNASNNQGFTLLEAIIILVIIGILAAFVAPGYLAWAQKSKVNSAISSVEGAIKESQRQAIAQSQSCNVTFNTSTPRVTSTADTTTTPKIYNCLLTGDRELSSVSMEVSTDNTNLASTTSSFNFDYSGNNLNSTDITVVLTHTRNTNLKRCLVVSSPLGLIRTGKYTGTSGAISGRCTP